MEPKYFCMEHGTAPVLNAGCGVEPAARLQGNMLRDASLLLGASAQLTRRHGGLQNGHDSRRGTTCWGRGFHGEYRADGRALRLREPTLRLHAAVHPNAVRGACDDPARSACGGRLF